MIISIWKTYPLDTHRSTRLSNTFFLYSLTSVTKKHSRSQPHTCAILKKKKHSHRRRLLTWSCLWGPRRRVATALESKSWPPDYEREKETGERKDNQNLSLLPVEIWAMVGPVSGSWSRCTAADLQLPDEFPAQVPAVHASVPFVSSARHQVVITFLLLSDKRDKTVLTKGHMHQLPTAISGTVTQC